MKSVNVSKPVSRVNSEACDAIAASIARVEKTTAGVDLALPRIIAQCGYLTDVLQPAVAVNGKNRYRVMQPVCSVNKPSIGRHQNL
jgi:hypothetical protein